MKSGVCFVCLKTSSTFGGDEEETRRLYSTFWRFATEYLGISSNRNASEDKLLPLLCKTGTFCGDCENVVSSICQLYRELLQTKLRLSSKLGELLGLMECSENLVSHKLGRLLIKSIAGQLGFRKTVDVDAIRRLLKNKCKLKRNETLPQVIIKRAKMSGTDVIKLEITPADLLEEMDIDLDDDDDVDCLFDNIDTLSTPEQPVEDKTSHSESSDEDIHEERNSLVEVGTDSEETAPQIKTEPWELDSDEEMMDQSPIAKVHLQEEQNYSDSTFEPESSSSQCDSDSDWATKKDKNRKSPVPSTSKKKTHPIRTTTQHHQQDEEGFSCPTCLKSFSTRRQQYHHVYKVHGSRIPCPECKKSFKTKNGLNEHLRSHINDAHAVHESSKTKNLNRKRNLGDNLTSSCSKNEADVFPCPSCSLVLPNRRRLTRHTRQVHSSECHPCPVQKCEKTFRTKDYLRRHISNFHKKRQEQKWYKCSMCPNTYSHETSLKSHYQYKHSASRPKILCPHCGITVIDNFRLERHMRIHTGEKPFSCQHCNTKFSRNDYLKTHLKSCVKK